MIRTVQREPSLRSSLTGKWLGYPLVVVVVFAATVATVILHHEMWHDELNSWDVARDATSLPGLFANMHFESHPALWYLCLYVITRFTHDPVAMQLLHLVIATGTVAVVAWFSPFTILERWLLVFGYFFVYEFAVISREYALGILLALAVCALYAKPRPRVVLLSILLALLANTSLYGLFLTVALGAGFALDGKLPRTRTLAVCAIGVILATAIALITLYPKPDNRFAPEWHRFDPVRVEGVLGLATAAYIPLPDLDDVPSPWNSSLILDEASELHALPRGLPAAVFSCVMLVSVILVLRRDRAAMTAFVLGTAMMLLFIYLKYSGGMRHHGHLFVLLVACIWIARRGVRPSKPSPALIVLLGVQVAAGAYFLVADYREPFSFSKDLTAYVRSLPGPTPLVVVQTGMLNYAGPVLSGYLRRPVTYVLAHRTFQGSFMVPDREHQHAATERDILNQLETFMRERGSDVYVVTNNWEPAAFGRPLARFERHLEMDERYANVYLLKRPR